MVIERKRSLTHEKYEIPGFQLPVSIQEDLQAIYPETVIRVRLLFLYTIPDKRETYNEKESWLLHILMNLVLMQASGNTLLSHFLGLVFSLELLRSVTLPQSDGIPIPKVA
ncbi:hypothetical protein Godav_000463 [Gossypium davidsonii]|uniref:Uncharacterized protein n=1 Tax=Gossypium davidsonii TaxID=34287 RepID=A0A7J8SZS9_GOSDV|nr:hypothetical protein [Gossypium davidsonii]